MRVRVAQCVANSCFVRAIRIDEECRMIVRDVFYSLSAGNRYGRQDGGGQYVIGVGLHRLHDEGRRESVNGTE